MPLEFHGATNDERSDGAVGHSIRPAEKARTSTVQHVVRASEVRTGLARDVPNRAAPAGLVRPAAEAGSALRQRRPLSRHWHPGRRLIASAHGAPRGHCHLRLLGHRRIDQPVSAAARRLRPALARPCPLAGRGDRLEQRLPGRHPGWRLVRRVSPLTRRSGGGGDGAAQADR